jgi:predicted regulator of Ras-like GTPase activity (Roadblock/LC7/MglB family)
MDAPAALERLRDISSQVRAAVIFERGGKVLGATFDDERAKKAASAAEQLLSDAERQGSGASSELAQLEVALQDGSVFVVRHGERLIAATTPPEPTVGLVFYDLKSALRELEAPPESKKKPKPPGKRAGAKPPPKPAAEKSAPKTKPPARKPKPKPDAKS